LLSQRRFYWIVLLGLVILSGCGKEAEPATSTPSAPSQTLAPTEDELATLIAMQQVATDIPTATPPPTATPTLTPTATLLPTGTSTPEPTLTTTAYPTNAPRSTQVILQPITPTVAVTFDPESDEQPLDHYWFSRPFPRDPSNTVHDYLSRSYPYGTTGSGQFAPHHGVDIQNYLGTSILAVANGTVLYAGSDEQEQFGPQKDFYGNLVVILHDFVASNGQPVYSLYGHMSSVAVEAGDYVMQGQKIGEVGATGVALGAHLHLEVRLGDPHAYGNTYNPDLWLQPWPTYGTLAGRLLDRSGREMHDIMITMRSVDTGTEYYTYSYADDEVNPDPYFGETFTRGDLPMGQYRVFVRMRGVLRFDTTVTIRDGQTSWVDIQLD
jgi:murein DD-endopeptidase MepM/ murein hydrolase activator NlpD